MSFNTTPNPEPKISKRMRGKQIPIFRSPPKKARLEVPPEQGAQAEEVNLSEQVAQATAEALPAQAPAVEGIECKVGCCCRKCRSILVGGLTFAQRRKRRDRKQEYGQKKGRPPKKRQENIAKKVEDRKRTLLKIPDPKTRAPKSRRKRKRDGTPSPKVIWAVLKDTG